MFGPCTVFCTAIRLAHFIHCMCVHRWCSYHPGHDSQHNKGKSVSSLEVFLGLSRGQPVYLFSFLTPVSGCLRSPACPGGSLACGIWRSPASRTSSRRTRRWSCSGPPGCVSSCASWGTLAGDTGSRRFHIWRVTWVRGQKRRVWRCMHFYPPPQCDGMNCGQITGHWPQMFSSIQSVTGQTFSPALWVKRVMTGSVFSFNNSLQRCFSCVGPPVNLQVILALKWFSTRLTDEISDPCEETWLRLSVLKRFEHGMCVSLWAHLNGWSCGDAGGLTDRTFSHSLDGGRPWSSPSCELGWHDSTERSEPEIKKKKTWSWNIKYEWNFTW